MAVFLSYASSLKYWRSDEPYYAGEVMSSPAFDPQFEDAECGVHALADVPSGLWHDECLRDVLVGKPSARRCNPSTSVQLISADIPVGSFYRIRRDLYACSPGLCFLLAASKLPFRALMTLGFELCGSYSLFNSSMNGIKHAPLSSVEELSTYLAQFRYAHGLTRARRALTYIRNGSASPRETDLFMMLCLPPRLGGFGLPEAKLNEILDVKKRARVATGLAAITPDLCWKEKRVALEYESTESHGAYVAPAELRLMNQRKLASDSERRRTYEAMQMTVLTVTNGEFIHYQDVERIAKLLARRLGKHGLTSTFAAEVKRHELHSWLRIPAERRSETI